MVGGFGTRLLPLTKTRPKPAMPVLDRPFLKYLIDSIAKAGVRDIILACGYKSDILAKEIGDGSDMGVNITYVDEDKPLGTAGAIKNVESLLDETFIAANGDTLNFVEVEPQIDTHFRTGADVTLSVSDIDDPTSSGVLLMDGSGYVLKIQEKPKMEEAISHTVNTGLYVLNKSILDYVPKGEFMDLSKDVFAILLEKGHKIAGHRAQGIWIDIGRPKDLVRINQTMAEMHVRDSDYSDVSKDSEIVGRSFIGNKTEISSSKIEDGIISSRCRINDSAVTNSLIMKGCSIDNAKIVNSILGENCRIGNGSEIVDAVLEDGTIIN